jgi:hypothetical protein
MRNFLNVFIALLAAGFLGPAMAQEWNPHDPQDADTKTYLSVAWARRLKGFRTFEEVQFAAGARGAILDRSLSGPEPKVSYRFRSDDGKHVSLMVVVVRKSGLVGISLATDDATVVMNNQGAFDCGLHGGHDTDHGDHCPR